MAKIKRKHKNKKKHNNIHNTKAFCENIVEYFINDSSSPIKI